MTCDCNGMEFLANRWVFTGQCPHKREERVQERIKELMLRRADVTIKPEGTIVTIEELAERARLIARKHREAVAGLRDESGDVSDANLPQYDEINGMYALDALELCQQFESGEQ